MGGGEKLGSTFNFGNVKIRGHCASLIQRMMVVKEKQPDSLKSCLFVLGDAGWFPELGSVLKKKKKKGEKDREEEGDGEGERKKERKNRNFPECRR